MASFWLIHSMVSFHIYFLFFASTLSPVPCPSDSVLSLVSSCTNLHNCSTDFFQNRYVSIVSSLSCSSSFIFILTSFSSSSSIIYSVGFPSAGQVLITVVCSSASSSSSSLYICAVTSIFRFYSLHPLLFCSFISSTALVAYFFIHFFMVMP